MSWFKKYGFEKNPFSIRENPDFVIKCNSEIIKNHLSSNNIVLLYGNTGSGKSSTLLKVMNGASNESVGIRINGKALSGVQGISFEKDYYKKVRRLFGMLKPNKDVYVYVDELQSMPGYLLDQIEGFWNDGLVKGIVAASLDDSLDKVECSPSFERRLGDNKLRTKNLTPDDCMKILNFRLQSGKGKIFEEAALRRIILANENVPSKILEECTNICLAFKDNKTQGEIIAEDEVKQYYEKKTSKPIIHEEPKSEVAEKVQKSDAEDLNKKMTDLKLDPKKQKDRLIALLFTGEGTTDKLMEKLNVKANTLSSMLGRLVRDGQANIVEELSKNRKRYELTPKFKQELVNR